MIVIFCQSFNESPKLRQLCLILGCHFDLSYIIFKIFSAPTEDTVPLFQFAVSMYLLTYVGAILNGLTLITLAWVAAFSAPRVYRDNQKQIDEALLPLKAKLDDLQGKLATALPASLTGKKAE